MHPASSADLISNFTQALIERNSNAPFVVVLIGSVARGTALAESDLDLLVLSETVVHRIQTNGPIHAQYFTETEFTDRLRAGDDFAAWCVRYGVPIVNGTIWTRVTASTEALTWPDWRCKLPHAARRLHLAASMLDMGDIDAAIEEALYALTHTGRAILIKAGDFPLSRPEMLRQLTNAGFPALSKLLQDFLFGSPDVAQVRKAISYVKKLLIRLDKEWYADHATERRLRAASKAQRT